MMPHARTALLAAALPLLAVPAATGNPDPWELLEAARQQLAAAGPQQTRFVQTYVPAGFSRGEEEWGTLAVALPDCLRWDYAEPFPKSFLVCGEEVWSWNPGESRGRRGRLDAEDASGLDLLLLSGERLADRYEAAASPAAGGAAAIELAPLAGAEAAFRDARLVLGPDGRPRTLSYRDREGNETRFELGAFRPLAATDAFAPPPGIEWEE